MSAFIVGDDSTRPFVAAEHVRRRNVAERNPSLLGRCTHGQVKFAVIPALYAGSKTMVKMGSYEFSCAPVYKINNNKRIL